MLEGDRPGRLRHRFETETHVCSAVTSVCKSFSNQLVPPSGLEPEYAV